jgi:hypothetical protein
MLESLVISTVFQSLPTIYPISVEESSSYHHQCPPKKQKIKPKMERVKKLSLEKSFPSLFAKTAGIFDNMLCCRSNMDDQIYEQEYEYKEEECSILRGSGSIAEKGDRKIKRSSTIHEPQQNRQYDLKDHQRSPPQRKKKGKVASRTTGTRAPCSPIGSSHSFATTVTANTSNTSEYDSCSARSSSRSALHTTETNELFLRESASDNDNSDTRSLTDRTISVPTSSSSSLWLKLDPEKRRWSEPEGCAEYEQQHADYYAAMPSEEEVIRKVQSESLAQLPYLSMTRGYRC